MLFQLSKWFAGFVFPIYCVCDFFLVYTFDEWVHATATPILCTRRWLHKQNKFSCLTACLKAGVLHSNSFKSLTECCILHVLLVLCYIYMHFFCYLSSIGTHVRSARYHVDACGVVQHLNYCLTRRIHGFNLQQNRQNNFKCEWQHQALL